jgi:hypothetical protein
MLKALYDLLENLILYLDGMMAFLRDELNLRATIGSMGISRTEKRANCHRLTQIQEDSLVQWILSMDRRGAAPRPSQIQDMANILLTNTSLNQFQPIGKNLVSSFVKRHDEIKTVNQNNHYLVIPRYPISHHRHDDI